MSIKATELKIMKVSKDNYHFAGNIQCKHRQIVIGNTMPFPTTCLRAREEAIDTKPKR
jgi:hypothetical protein